MSRRRAVAAVFLPFLAGALLVSGAAMGGTSPPSGSGPSSGGSGPAGAAGDPPADHVVFISVDGLRPEFYLDPAWPAPQMRRMAREGAHARVLRGVAPTVTYPSHTTLVTGALPATHGIHQNRTFEDDGFSGRWQVESERIRVPTLWDAVAEDGRASAGICWPVTVGAPIDWNIPEFFAMGSDNDGSPGPEDHTAALRTAVSPEGLLEEMEERVLGTFPDFYWGRNRSREDAVAAMAGHLIEEKEPHLLLVHLSQTDWHQHEYGREHGDVELAVAAVDRAIARMAEAAERAGTLERTAFVVSGDHGFVDVDTRIFPNAWLAEAGLRGDGGEDGDAAWRASFHSATGSAFLRLRDPDDREAVEEVREVLDALPSGVRSLFRVVEREELDRLGADPDSPLALAPVPGVIVGEDPDDPAVRPASGGAHGYFPHVDDVRTGFLAWGAGVSEGVSVPRMGIEDVAPFVAALLDLDFDAPDGVLRPGLLEEG